MSMNSIFTYTDYRNALRDYYDTQKALGSFMSYRWLGKKLHVDPSLLVKVLRCERHLAEESLPLLKNIFAHNPKESDFFDALYFFSKSTQDNETALYYERMKQAEGVQSTQVSTLQYSFYESWIHSALWALLHVQPNQSIAYYAQKLQPKCTEAQVKNSLDVLQSLGFLKITVDGSHVLCVKHLQSGPPIKKEVLRGFYRQMLELATRALEEIPPESREISGITVAADESCLQDIKEIIYDARKKIQLRVDEVQQAQSVIQISFQIFPLSGMDV